VRLIRPDGHEAREFVLHVEGNRAKWRCWNREPSNRLTELTETAPARAPERVARRSLVAALIAVLAAIVLPAAALARPIQHRQSSNWAGYAVTAATPFHSVSGRWIEPAATCDQGFPTYSAFWVGLGGFKQNSQKLEQIGIEADCTAHGRASTFAWYELVPNAPVQLKLRVRPGDVVTARVTLDGSRVGLRIQNLTTHRRFAKTLSFPAPDTSSAEWIAEAPSECVSANLCQTLPLTDFGTVHFTSSTATSAGAHPGTITDPAFTATELTLSSDAPVAGPRRVAFTPASGGATPSGVSALGGAFVVTFQRGTPAATPAPLAAPDQLRHTPKIARPSIALPG
jgi:hypothetical protein